mgnify:CR=1 FL=1
MKNNFQNLILKFNLSQVKVADIIGVSRPTLAKILSGDREIRVSEAEKFANFVGIAVDEVFGADGVEVVLESAKKSLESIQNKVRISVPAKNVKKFKNALLYITQKIGAFPNVGQTVLYKILYFCDFDYYEKHEEQLIGATYIKNHFGPTPREFSVIVEDMIKSGEIEEVKTRFFKKEQRKYIPVIEPDLSVFTGQELQHIDYEIKRLGDKTARELSDFSHQDVPWISAKIGEDISYESVFYRTEKTSVRKYEEDRL